MGIVGKINKGSKKEKSYTLIEVRTGWYAFEKLCLHPVRYFYATLNQIQYCLQIAILL